MSFICVGPITTHKYSFFGVSGSCPFTLSQYILEHGDEPNAITDFLEGYALQIETYNNETIRSYRYQLLAYLFQKFRTSTVVISAPNSTCQSVGFAQVNQIVLGTAQIHILKPLIEPLVLGSGKI